MTMNEIEVKKPFPIFKLSFFVLKIVDDAISLIHQHMRRQIMCSGRKKVKETEEEAGGDRGFDILRSLPVQYVLPADLRVGISPVMLDLLQ